MISIKKAVTAMILYKPRQRRDVFEIYGQLRRAGGIKGKRTPHGFEAAAGFNPGDIYVSDGLYRDLTDGLRKEIDSCLSRLARGDYGLY